MRFITVALSAALAYAVSANPVPQNSSETVDNVFKRANVLPVQCGPTGKQKAYTANAVQTAVNALQSHLNQPVMTWPKAGDVAYPKPFYGGKPGVEDDVIDALKTVKCYIGKTPNQKKPYPELWEFPLQDSEFTGSDKSKQGSDRVIVMATNNAVNGAHPKTQYTNFNYCIATTHPDPQNKNVIPCQSSTS